MNTTFDLNAYGVQQMSHQEMVETDGGFRIIMISSMYAMRAVVSWAAGEVAAGFSSGFEEAREARCIC